MTWIASIVGERFARPVLIGGGVLLLFAIVFLIGRCSKDDYEDDYRAQIEQTDRENTALADAAEGAIQTLENRTATEDAIDQATQAALTDIDAAVSPEQVRNAVLMGVCNTDEHRNDPGCQK